MEKKCKQNKDEQIQQDGFHKVAPSGHSDHFLNSRVMEKVKASVSVNGLGKTEVDFELRRVRPGNKYIAMRTRMINEFVEKLDDTIRITKNFHAVSRTTKEEKRAQIIMTQLYLLRKEL